MWSLWLGEESKNAAQHTLRVRFLGDDGRDALRQKCGFQSCLVVVFGGIMQLTLPLFFYSICDCVLCEINILSPLS